MPTTIVLQQAGPLPVSANFSLPTSATPAVLMVYGSVWTQQSNVMIGCQISIDGSVMGEATVFSNESTTHRQFVPRAIQLQDDAAAASTTPETLTVQLSAGPNTVSDSNDSYLVVLHH